jgi:hypothetical protein
MEQRDEQQRDCCESHWQNLFLLGLEYLKQRALLQGKVSAMLGLSLGPAAAFVVPGLQSHLVF